MSLGHDKPVALGTVLYICNWVLLEHSLVMYLSTEGDFFADLFLCIEFFPQLLCSYMYCNNSLNIHVLGDFRKYPYHTTGGILEF